MVDGWAVHRLAAASNTSGEAEASPSARTSKFDTGGQSSMLFANVSGAVTALAGRLSAGGGVPVSSYATREQGFVVLQFKSGSCAAGRISMNALPVPSAWVVPLASTALPVGGAAV